MPVPTTAADLSTTAGSNSPAGTDAIGTSLDEYLRAIQAIVKQENSAGSDIASATTIAIPSSGSYFAVTGTTAITTISDSWTGRTVLLKFSGILTFTHSSGLILPGAANITTAAGDVAVITNESTGVWRCDAYLRSALAPGAATSLTTTSTVQVTNLNAQYFGNLSTAQVAVLGTASVQALNVSHFGNLTTAQVAVLGTTAVQALNVSHFGSLTTAQVAVLGTASVQALNVSHFGSLTTSQVAVLAGTPSFATTIGVGAATASASGAGITFPATESASTNANTLDDYDEYTSASTACTTAITASVAWRLVKIGKVVTMHIPQVQGAAAAQPYFTVGATIPAKYRPVSSDANFAVPVYDNSAIASTPGLLNVASGGSMALYRNLTASGNFTGSGNAGTIGSICVSWVL